MNNSLENTKRIAKNTMFLYIRMLFLMCISFFTTRVILQTLGVNDYGIYNVVGGVVSLFSILSKTLSTASSRFLNFEMGRGDEEKLKQVFSTTLTIQIVIAIVVALLVEILGLWFIDNKLNIPSDRLWAANWVMHFSALTFCLELISVPYNAAIIAHEKMKVFSYISIYEGLAKLGICYLIIISPIDKLVFYAGLLCFVQVSVRFIYSKYCLHHFEECKYRFVYNKDLILELFTFAGWNFIGGTASILRVQGGNMLVNIFAGPSVNAAMGVANQVNTAVLNFSNNFMVAVKPQITKSYAAGELAYVEQLVTKSARFSFYLLLLISFPILLNIDYVLDLWLSEVPNKTSIFIILIISFSLLSTFSSPLITSQLACGKTRDFQLIVGGLTLLNIPVSYLFLKIGFGVEVTLYVAICIELVCLIARLIIVSKSSGISIHHFFYDVIIRCFVVTLISLIIPILFEIVVEPTPMISILKTVLSYTVCLLVVWNFGISSSERVFFLKSIQNFLNKQKK